MMLTKEQAQALKLPAEVWLEYSGGFEKSRYRAEKATATHKTDDAMCFLHRAGRAWDAYNREYCGWRLWSKKPALEEQLAKEWKRE